MDYLTAQEAAEKWGITRRRVQVLCVQNRIAGAVKKANLWLIPKSSQRPNDKRCSEENFKMPLKNRYGE